ncbi:MAG: TetR-like C-terminal domain-containing protein [Nannocystaceae bacterium]
MGRRKGPALTREQVIEAGVACVRAHGADALGVARVARILGIQPPSIYNHIGKGDALARGVVIEANRQLLAALTKAAVDVEDPAQRLRLLARALRSWVLGNANLYALMARVEPDNDHPEFAPVIEAMLELFGRPLEQLGVGDDEIIHALRSLRSMMHGFVLLETTRQFQYEQVPAESFEWAVEMFLRGVDRRPRAG